MNLRRPVLPTIMRMPVKLRGKPVFRSSAYLYELYDGKS
ncbi:hypothetical protein PC129_g7878 [Phytophthora cactorum]|uniref:Uncharacterized protein n=1 Tax=Phytophthora cactorum TaxID=29920 RepID=A0A8T0Z7K4_9STRA|nr:hypothetical protein Pcac1_g9281 [Phytophthora cactorum]KAG2825223.1 hypothetical protein PC112_g9788 [Phytophthora cactorum]KAG2827408.1 hypothetical protein PC111_g8597 [Phytophthora cactorum]KAG2858124.1 hypothetical protein PC113_g10076 [Phytophthora cactorum]KAG2907976.1 hypothetical protein PC114_g10665 [Phytophthora cactorum]